MSAEWHAQRAPNRTTGKYLKNGMSRWMCECIWCRLPVFTTINHWPVKDTQYKWIYIHICIHIANIKNFIAKRHRTVWKYANPADVLVYLDLCVFSGTRDTGSHGDQQGSMTWKVLVDTLGHIFFYSSIIELWWTCHHHEGNYLVCGSWQTTSEWHKGSFLDLLVDLSVGLVVVLRRRVFALLLRIYNIMLIQGPLEGHLLTSHIRGFGYSGAQRGVKPSDPLHQPLYPRLRSSKWKGFGGAAGEMSILLIEGNALWANHGIIWLYWWVDYQKCREWQIFFSNYVRQVPIKGWYHRTFNLGCRWSNESPNTTGTFHYLQFQEKHYQPTLSDCRRATRVRFQIPVRT